MSKSYKNNSKSKTATKKNELVYADKKIYQEYYEITKELGSMRFLGKSPAGKEFVCSLPNGVARRARGMGINKLKQNFWVLAQPISSNLEGVQEIVVVYTKKQSDTLQKEGHFSKFEENKVEEDLGYVFEGDQEDHNKMDDDIDIDNL
jgi:hypothetical protein